MDKFSVTIMPENLTVYVPQGTNLINAAKTAGIDIESPCGCRGTCGKCQVKIINLGGVDCPDSDYVLACQTRVEKDMVIEAPQFSRLTKHKVLLSSEEKESLLEHGYFKDVEVNPLCKKIYAELDKPDLTDSMSDLDRVRMHLMKNCGIEDVKISISALRKLSNVVREGDFNITLTIVTIKDSAEIINIEAGKPDSPSLGLAVDIGTTTVVVNLIDTENGKIIDSAGTYNKQSAYGSDVISRIVYCDENDNGLELLQKAVIETINELIDTVLKKNKINKSDIPVMVCAGNTVMSHMFLNMPPTFIRLEPYVPGASKYPVVSSKDLGININPDAKVITLPSVASYVGGDITSGVLSTLMSKSELLTLFIDVGTNGELVLGNSDWMVSCSCSAGPAFEGSGITCGMRAMDGAIDWIEIDKESMEVKVRAIGNKKPLGICGSGLIYSLSEMLDSGIIDRAGNILENGSSIRVRMGNEGKEFVLVFAKDSGSGRDVVVTEGDIKNLIRAKGAIFAGIRTMLQQVELDVDAIDRVYIAGGFGNYINITDAVNIGLFPDLPADKYAYIGNSSVHGAMLVLLCQEALYEIEDISDRITYIELSIGNKFMDEFISALFIPHTNLNLFQRCGV
ncbi:Na(+)-translocating NADH-quinone reductase subunit F [Oxobacter pfennigii]|uniref:Na(+)-translocating NADH-quinone reductase subunit F n=1 Tax=Oxobacter pfennigii TaxID=36849 RepID=A0A0P8YVT0_9CLOT|nr:ASKHA domain-containing protein [Oxobacter pfennigii]KPU43813.1 Na(+)-translocating NADH-quinone reductase subunit F [Oxobacter pfennigii]